VFCSGLGNKKRVRKHNKGGVTKKGGGVAFPRKTKGRVGKVTGRTHREKDSKERRVHRPLPQKSQGDTDARIEEWQWKRGFLAIESKTKTVRKWVHALDVEEGVSKKEKDNGWKGN